MLALPPSLIPLQLCVRFQNASLSFGRRVHHVSWSRIRWENKDLYRFKLRVKHRLRTMTSPLGMIEVPLMPEQLERLELTFLMWHYIRTQQEAANTGLNMLPFADLSKVFAVFSHMRLFRGLLRGEIKINQLNELNYVGPSSSYLTGYKLDGGGHQPRTCSTRCRYLRPRLCPGSRKWWVCMGYYGLGGGMEHQNVDVKTLRTREGGGDSGEPFGQRSCGANILAAITQSVPWQARLLLYLIRLRLISLICPHILQPICGGSPCSSLKVFPLFFVFLNLPLMQIMFCFIIYFFYIFSLHFGAKIRPRSQCQPPPVSLLLLSFASKNKKQIPLWSDPCCCFSTAAAQRTRRAPLDFFRCLSIPLSGY